MYTSYIKRPNRVFNFSVISPGPPPPPFIGEGNKLKLQKEFDKNRDGADLYRTACAYACLINVIIKKNRSLFNVYFFLLYIIGIVPT